MAAGLRRTAATITLALALLTAPAQAATIDVTTEADALADDGQCSLREALNAANGDTAGGGCAAGAGTDTIALPAGVFELSIAGGDENANATGDLDATSDVDFRGAGAERTVIRATTTDRILDVPAGKTVSVDGLTMTGGRAPAGAAGAPATGADGAAGQPGAGATGGAGGAGSDGGSILNAGTLTVSNVIMRNSRAGNGGNGGVAIGGAGGTDAAGGTAMGGPGGAGGHGGAIANRGTLVVRRTVIRSARAGDGGRGGGAGGGVGGAASGNNAGAGGGAGVGPLGGPGGAGGAIYTTDLGDATGAITIEDSTISSNSAGSGGRGGTAIGGDGGAGAGTGAGGAAGAGTGGNASPGGAGGAIAVTGSPPTTITGSAIVANSGGAGGAGGIAAGGYGAADGPGSGGGGGAGAPGLGGAGAAGGAGGGVLKVSATNVTLDANSAGPGGLGGIGIGGDGGTGQGASSPGGAGGNATGGVGGAGGAGGAASDSRLVHATITDSTRGSGGAGGLVAGGFGAPGTVPGANGSNTLGASGSPGDGEAVVGGRLQNTIVASRADTRPCSGAPADDGGNVDFPSSNCPGMAIDPKLAALDDNGGPTATRALEPGSAARDLVPGAGAGCPATDQRGLPRPQGSACDAGAYEAGTGPSASTGAASGVGPAAATLNGTVVTNLRATSYYFRFGKTDAYGSRTPVQDATAGLEPAPAAAVLTGLDPSTTYHYRIVATNEDGIAVGEDASFTTAALPDTVAPVFLSASLTRKTWTLKQGTTFKYSLSEAAQVAFTIQRARAGRRVGKACKKPTRANRKRTKCTRYSLAGRFGQGAVAGPNVRRFLGKLGGKPLAPGAYRASLVATDAAGNKSAPKRLAFKVVKARR
jgi:CSLREA domain-containing protein